jgi:hypothetical protein
MDPVDLRDRSDVIVALVVVVSAILIGLGTALAGARFTF